MSTWTCSSSHTSWTSESGFPGEGNTWNDALNAADHGKTGEILRAFWGWNGATAVSGTCHFAMVLAFTRRTFVWPAYLSGVLIQNDLMLVGHESEVGSLMDNKGSCVTL